MATDKEHTQAAEHITQVQERNRGDLREKQQPEWVQEHQKKARRTAAVGSCSPETLSISSHNAERKEADERKLDQGKIFQDIDSWIRTRLFKARDLAHDAAAAHLVPHRRIRHQHASICALESRPGASGEGLVDSGAALDPAARNLLFPCYPQGLAGA
eukprot:3084248-Rhodomonas_salina.3